MLSRAPFVSVVLFLATGILAGDALRTDVGMPGVFILVASVPLTIGCLLLFSFGRRKAFGVALAVWMFVLGVGIKMWVEEQKDARLAALHALKYTSYIAEVTTNPEKRNNSVRLEVKTSCYISEINGLLFQRVHWFICRTALPGFPSREIAL